MSGRPPSGIAHAAADTGPLISDAIRALAAVEDRGIWFEDEFTPWSEAVAASAARGAVLRELLATEAPGGPAHVGVLLENTPEYLHLLGAAAIGEIVVAGLNSTRAGAALARDVTTADCGVVLTDAAHAHLFEDLDLGGVRVLRVDSPSWRYRVARVAGSSYPDPGDQPVDPTSPGDQPTNPTGPDDLVCLVFTSGTSGDPKAVRVTQDKIAVPGRMLTERFGITRADRIYSAMPLFHSNAVMVAWPMAAFAATSIVLRRRFSASGWLDDVRRYGCTFANYVGAPLTYILATPERPDDADNPMRVVYGNEAPADVRERFAARFGVTVVDGFGSTEGGVAITRTPETPPAALGPLPDGVRVVDPVDGTERPRAGHDDAGAPVAGDDVVGELVAEGRGLFAGYYGDPAADAERMRGGRFRTGDLAYVDEAGFVYFAGRSSGWMRVDGENLAAAPIERILQRHPAVEQVAVYAVPAAVGDAVMAAVVLGGGGGRGGGRERGAAVDEFEAGFADFLDAQPDLGPKQRPSYVRVTDELPRTASFKVRTRDLTARGVEPGGDRVFPNPGGVHLF